MSAKDGWNWSKGWEWLTSPISNETEATQVLKAVSMAWYALGGLGAILFTYLFFLKPGPPLFLLDVAVYFLAGFFLAEKIGVVRLLFLFAYAACVGGLTIATRLGAFEGTGKNVVAIIIIVRVALRGLRATFVYHRSINSHISWRNILIVWAIVIGFSVVSCAAVLFGLAFVGTDIPSMSDEKLGAWLLIPLAIGWGIAFVVLPKRFPFTGSRRGEQRTENVTRARP